MLIDDDNLVPEVSQYWAFYRNSRWFIGPDESVMPDGCSNVVMVSYILQALRAGMPPVRPPGEGPYHNDLIGNQYYRAFYFLEDSQEVERHREVVLELQKELQEMMADADRRRRS